MLTEEEDVHAGQERLLIDSQVSSNEVLSVVWREEIFNVWDRVLAQVKHSHSVGCLHNVVVCWRKLCLTLLEGQQALEISVFSWQGLAQSKQQHNFGLGDLTKNVELSEPNLEH